MNTKTIEGIVVKSIHYQESKRIITLFTREGLLTLMATVYPKQPHSVSLTTPLCIADFCYKKNDSDLHFLKEGSIISSHTSYNTSYARLEAAFCLLKTLLASQLPAKPAPLLYELTKLYLRQLPFAVAPCNLASSFTLKALRHEGLLPLEGVCTQCAAQEARSFSQGESYCKTCAPPSTLFFTEEEWVGVQTLLFSKDLKTIDSQSLSPEAHNKIKNLFASLVH